VIIAFPPGQYTGVANAAGPSRNLTRTVGNCGVGAGATPPSTQRASSGPGRRPFASRTLRGAASARCARASMASVARRTPEEGDLSFRIRTSAGRGGGHDASFPDHGASRAPSGTGSRSSDRSHLRRADGSIGFRPACLSVAPLKMNPAATEGTHIPVVAQPVNGVFCPPSNWGWAGNHRPSIADVIIRRGAVIGLYPRTPSARRNPTETSPSHQRGQPSPGRRAGFEAPRART
jgi:hypothetical protein